MVDMTPALEVLGQIAANITEGKSLTAQPLQLLLKTIEGYLPPRSRNDATTPLQDFLAAATNWAKNYDEPITVEHDLSARKASAERWLDGLVKYLKGFELSQPCRLSELEALERIAPAIAVIYSLLEVGLAELNHPHPELQEYLDRVIAEAIMKLNAPVVPL